MKSIFIITAVFLNFNVCFAQEIIYKDYLFLILPMDLKPRLVTDIFDLKIPVTDKIIIDFNKSYNPYCAYNIRYSCPVLPDENLLP
jgi:uncharacterized protein